MWEVTTRIVLSIIAILLPPAPALFMVAFKSHFWFNLLLTLLGWIPGVIHALWLIWAGPTAN